MNNTLNIENTLFRLKNFISNNQILLIMLILIIIISTIVGTIRAKKKKTIIVNDNTKNDPLLEHHDYKNLETKEQIQQLAFEKLKEIKIAKMNFDLDTIRTITTDNVYDLYNRQVNTLKEKKQKNIVQNIKYINSHITNINTIANEKIINLRIIIECYDFINDNNNKTISGKYNKKMLQTYELEIKTKNNNYIINKIQLLYEREI